MVRKLKQKYEAQIEFNKKTRVNSDEFQDTKEQNMPLQSNDKEESSKEKPPTVDRCESFAL